MCLAADRELADLDEYLVASRGSRRASEHEPSTTPAAQRDAVVGDTVGCDDIGMAEPVEQDAGRAAALLDRLAWLAAGEENDDEGGGTAEVQHQQTADNSYVPASYLPTRPGTSHGRGRALNAMEPPMIAHDERDAELERIANYERACGPITAGVQNFALALLNDSPGRSHLFFLGQPRSRLPCRRLARPRQELRRIRASLLCSAKTAWRMCCSQMGGHRLRLVRQFSSGGSTAMLDGRALPWNRPRACRRSSAVTSSQRSVPRMHRTFGQPRISRMPAIHRLVVTHLDRT